MITGVLIVPNKTLILQTMTDFNPDEMSTEAVVEQLKNIAESGQVEIEWTDLQRALRSRLEFVLEGYKERACGKESQCEEPNVDKFNLEHSRDEILELIASFNEPPFTIQRICELLYTPFKYYDRVSTFFRGLEKNLRVISSNDWPKSQVDQKMNETTSTKPPDQSETSEQSSESLDITQGLRILPGT